MSTSPDYERVLLVKPVVYVYQIPPMTSMARGFRAGDWNLPKADYVGRLRLTSNGDKCFVRIEDQGTGDLYCQAPVDAYPGPQVQPVSDSRRFFVVRVVSDTGRSALLGLGFDDSSDSFDFNVALQDHFMAIEKAKTADKQGEESTPKLDLSLKGDIRVNLNINGLRTSADGSQSSSTNSSNATTTSSTKTQGSTDPSKPFVLPPPPQSTRRR